MANLQVKGMDDDLYESLRARANMDHRSISQEVVTIINDFLSRAPSDPVDQDDSLLKLAGCWEDERRSEDIVSDIRDARGTGRRFRRNDSVSD